MTHTLVGRIAEINRVKKIKDSGSPAILAVYGRRRVGKSALIEYCLSKEIEAKKVWKFEGLQNKKEEAQLEHLIKILKKFIKIKKNRKITSWYDFFSLIAEEIKEGVILYFEELQWIADYKENFLSELKPIWDEKLSKRKNSLIILCGSSPSFMITNVVKSQSLYGRSMEVLHLTQFTLEETRDFLSKSKEATLESYLIVGGIPEYLKYLKKESSSLVSLYRNAFVKNSYFVEEYERVFISSFAKNPDYKKVLEFLAMRRYCTREEILKFLGKDSGGWISGLLLDLEECGFIIASSPFHLGGKKSKLIRYSIADNYLHFYYVFIKPKLARIQRGEFDRTPDRAINKAKLSQWLGFAFERYCRENFHLIADILNFSGIEYQAGSYFGREDKNKFQFDLVFDRKDKVLTLCEVKYQINKVSSSIIPEFENRVDKIKKKFKRYDFQSVLIAPFGAEEKVKEYFDRVLEIGDISSLSPVY